MSPVHFLFIALAIAALGILVAVSRHRQPVRPESAMDDFRREMQALAPRDDAASRPGRPTQSDGAGAFRSDIKVDNTPGDDPGDDED